MNVCCNIHIATCQRYELIFLWYIFQFFNDDEDGENRFFAMFGVSEKKIRSTVKT